MGFKRGGEPVAVKPFRVDRGRLEADCGLSRGFAFRFGEVEVWGGGGTLAEDVGAFGTVCDFAVD